MVDLPSISQPAATRGSDAARAPTSTVSASQIASPYMELAGFFSEASKELGGVANRAAEDAGRTAVTRDDEGNVQVERPFIIGDAALHYQHGVKVAAVADGENVIKTDLLAMRHKFENDPDGFAKAAGAYTKEKVAQYQKVAGPEVGITLGRIANHASLEFHEGLLNQKERRDIANAKTSIEAQIESTKNEIFAIAAGGDDTSPAFIQRLQKIGALQGQLINNPKFGVPRALAEYDMSRLKSELAVATLGYKLGEVQKRDGTEAAIMKADSIKTDPTLQLTPPERFSLHSRLVGGIMAQERGEAAIRKQVDQKIDAAFDEAVKGYPLPASQAAALRTEVGMTNSPALAAKLSEVEQIAPIINSWKQSNPAQMEQTLAGLEAQMREHGSLPGLRKMKEAGETLLKNMREGVKNDIIDWTNRTGTLPIPPIDWASTNHASIATQLRERISLAESAAAHYGRPVQYLTPDDKAIAQQAAKVGGQPMLDFARSVVEGAGPKAPIVLAEISKDAPVLAHVGSLMQAGGAPGIIRDAAEAVRLAADPTFTHPRWLDKESESIQAAQNKVKVEQYGSAFALLTQSGYAAVQTAQKAFFTRSAEKGYDPKMPDSSEKIAFERTLQEAAGARYQGSERYGGVDSYTPGSWSPFGWRTEYKVALPTNVKSGEFKTIINAIRDEDLTGTKSPEGKPYTVARLRAALPVAVAGGYQFILGDPFDDNPRPLMGSNGQPFVLDLHALEPTLRKRVGFAYAY